jgi:hypothetical protein
MLYFLSTGSGRFLNLWGMALMLMQASPWASRFKSHTIRLTRDVDCSGGLNVFDRNVFIEVQTAVGNVWMLDNVDRQ